MLFSLPKHHLDLNITDTVLKVSRSLYCFTTSISHGVENYIPRLWGTGISDAIFFSPGSNGIHQYRLRSDQDLIKFVKKVPTEPVG